MADIRQYADWLVANQNKKGTPEFETVANAYKQLRQSPQQSAGPDTSLLSGMANSALRIGSGMADFLPTVNKALTGYENPRLLFGDGDGKLTLNDFTSMRMVDEKDVPSNMQNPFAFSGTEFEDAADFLKKKQKELNYQPKVPWEQLKSDPSVGNILAFMGEQAVTSLPDMAAALISTPAYFTSYVAPIAEERAKNDGRENVTPSDIIIAMGSSAAIAGAERFGAKGIFGGMTGNAVTRPVKAGVREAGTEAMQNPIEYAGGTVGTEAGFDPAVALDQAAAGAVGGFGAGTGIRTVNEVVGVGKESSKQAVADAAAKAGDVLNPAMIGYDRQAAADLGQRIQRIAQANDLDLKNVTKTSTSGAREAVDKAHIQISEELKQLARDLKKQLGITDADSEAIVFDKVMAIAGQRQARNKAKSTVGVEEMQAIERLTGNTREGQRMLSLMRQMNELTTLHNSGYVAGVSKFTDQLSPLPTNVGYSDRSLIETPTRVLGSLYGASINPLIPAAQATAVVGGRAVDALTGRRSRVARYVKDNAGNRGIDTSQQPSVREQKQRELAARDAYYNDLNQRETEMHKELYNQNGSFSPLSPQQIILDELGLSPQQAVKVLEELKKNEAFKDAAEKAIKSFKEGGRIESLKLVAPAMRGVLADPNNELKSDREPQPGAAQRAQAQVESPAYLRGIQSNRELNSELVDQVQNDPSISPADKGILLTALNRLGLNLGNNPSEEAVEIAVEAERNLSQPELADKYIGPYLNRVLRQQASNEDVTVMRSQSTTQPVNDPMRISPRRPTAVAATENPLTDDLQIDSAAILDSSLGAKLLPKVMNYLGVRGERQVGDNRADEQIFIDHIKNNLLHLYNSVSPEYRERAKQWYVGANKLSQEAADKYSLDLHQVAGVMAALSPQKDWYMNYDLGIRTIDSYRKIQPTDEFTKPMASAFRRMIKKQQPGPQKTLKATLKLINGAQFQDLNTYEKAVFIRFYDEVNNPERGHRIITPEGDLADFQRTVKGEKSGTAWNGFGDIQKAVEIIENGARENVDIQLGMMHKVRSFYNNILNPMSDRGDVTIDTHAVAAGHLRPFSGNHQEVMENFKGGGKSGVSGAVGAYGLYADAYRAAAAEAGVLPREMQSITWEAVRGLFTPQYKGQKKNQETIANIWKRYDAGDIMIDQARQEIFDAAGGINRAAWEGTGPDNPTVEQNRSLADPGNIPGTGVPGTGNRRGTGSEPSGPLLRSAQTVRLTGTFDDGESYAEQEAEALDLQERLGKQQNVARFFEKSKRVVRKAVRRLDPEGRETMSVLAAGLNGKGVSNEDLEVITPLLVDSFATLSTMPPEVFGEYVERKNRETGEVKRSIRLKQIGDETIEDVMTPQQFMNTFLHELGHSIEAQSGFREFLTVLQFVANNSSDQDMMKLHEDVVNISRSRRPELWAGVDFKLQNLQTQTQVVIPDATEIAKMDRNELYQLGLRIDEDFTEQGIISPTGTFMNTLAGIKTDVDYAYNPAELGADVIAAYLYAPAAFKKNYPEVAERVREVVNNSDIKDFITFHSLASILGVGTMAALLAGADDEEEKGVLSLGSGALSAA